MVNSKFLKQITNVISILSVSTLLLGTLLTAPSQSMETVPEVLEETTAVPLKSRDLAPEETCRCMKKAERCCYKERSCDDILHNVCTESTRGLQSFWNLLMCRGCKHNRRLEKEM